MAAASSSVPVGRKLSFVQDEIFELFPVMMDRGSVVLGGAKAEMVDQDVRAYMSV